MTGVVSGQKGIGGDRLGWKVLAVLPMVTIALFAGLVMLSRVRFGAWPTPNTPDPKDVSGGLVVAVSAGYLISIVATFAVVAGLPISRRARFDRSDGATWVLSVLGFGALLMLIQGDLGTWLLD